MTSDRSPASSRGTLALLVGLVVQAGASYVYLVVAGRELGVTPFGALSGLYLLVVSLCAGLFVPLEQEVIRLRSTAAAAGTRDPALGRRTLGHVLAMSLATAAVAGAALPAVLGILGDRPVLLLALLLTVPGYGCWSARRGELASQRRLVLYGVLLGVDGAVRGLGAVVLAAAHVHSVGAYGFLIALAPWVAFAITGLFRRRATGLADVRTPSEWRPLYVLVVSGLAAQLLVNAGPLVINLLAGVGDRARAGAFLAVLVVIRVPIFLFAAVQPRFLPVMVGRAAARDRAAFTRIVALLTGGTAAVLVVGIAGTVLLGPPVTELVFGFGGQFGRGVYLLLAVSVSVFLLATIVAQALVALVRHTWVTTSWVAGLVGLVLGTLPGTDPVARATTGLLVGAVVAAVALVIGLVASIRDRRRWTEPTPART